MGLVAHDDAGEVIGVAELLSDGHVVAYLALPPSGSLSRLTLTGVVL